MKLLPLIALCISGLNGFASNNEKNFLLPLPGALYAEPDNTFMFNLRNFNYYPATVKLQFKTDDGNDLLFSALREVPASHQRHTYDHIEVTIPSNISISKDITSKVFVDVHTNEGSVYSDFRKVLLNPARPPLRLFSQDKPQYRLGDHAHFQLTSLDHKLRPADGPRTIPEVWVTNPADQRVAQWRDTPLKYGIANINFIISEEFVSPLTELSTVTEDGSKNTWNIHFKGDDYLIKHSFTVGEVAPPPVFDLNATSHDVFEFGGLTMTVDVCARYHFGSNLVGGKVVVWSSPDWTENVYIFGNATTKENGCVSIDMSTRETHFDESNLHVNVTESTNGITETKKVNVRTRMPMGRFLGMTSYDLKLVSDFKTFPATLNRTLTFVLKNHGEEVDNRPIKFCTTTKYFPPSRQAGQEELPGENSPFVDYSFLLPSDEYEKLSPETLEELNNIPMLWERSRHRRSLSTNPDCRTVNTGRGGLVKYTLTPQDERVHTIRLTAFDPEINSSLFAQNFPVMTSPSGSHMALDLPSLKRKLPCQGDVKLKVATTVTNNLPPFQYQVMARGRVVADGVTDGASPLDLTLSMTPEMSPSVKVVVYAQLADGEVMADSVELPVETCFPNEVAVSWDQEEATPGSTASLHVTAAPHSRCTVSVKEAGLGARGRGSEDFELSRERLVEQLHQLSVSADFASHRAQILFPGHNQEDPSVAQYCRALQVKMFDILLTAGVQTKSLHKLRRGWTEDFQHEHNYQRTFHMDLFADASEAFENAGFKVFSKRGLLNRPCIKKENRVWVAFGRNRRAARFAPLPAVPPQQYDVHDDRKEVIYHDAHTLDAYGSGHVTVHLPGQATAWVASVVCTHPKKGLGISKKVSIKSSKLFFSTISIPRSVRRNDYLNGSITVFNNYDSAVSAFLQHEVPYFVDTDAPVVYRPLSLQVNRYEFCVAAHSSVTYPLSLRFDTVEKRNISVLLSATDGFCEYQNTVHPPRYVISKEVTVLPDGYPQEEISAHFVCPDAERQDISVPLDAPAEHMVPNSAWLSVSVAGEPHDPPDLKVLFKTPDAGAETNTLTTLMNVYGYAYIHATGLMTSELEGKFDEHIREGVDLILKDQRTDKSYSTYGDEDKEGSLWLTLLITKTFNVARAFNPYVAEHFGEIVNVDWVMRHHRPDGCFYPTGELLHQELRGGVEREAVGSLTAYAVLTLHGVIDTYRLGSSLSCLDRYVTDPDTSRYTKALIAYTYLRLGLEHRGTVLVEILADHLITEGRKMLYWQEDRTVSGYGTRPAASLEMTAYMLASLVHISGPRHMELANRASNWIVEQLKEQTTSVQARAAAMEALAVFFSRKYGSKKRSIVYITTGGDSMPYSVHVNTRNRRLFQTHKIRPVTLPTEVRFAVTGECVNLQTSLRYASKIQIPKPYYNVELSATEVFRARSPGSLYTVHVCVAVRHGGLPSDKAALLINLPPAFVPVSGTLWQQVYEHKIETFSSAERSVSITMAKVGDESKCFDFRMLRAAEKEEQEQIQLSINDAHEHSLQTRTIYTIPEVHQATEYPPHYPFGY